MLKIPENKSRKRLRIAICIFYLFEIVMCAWPFMQTYSEADGLRQITVFETISAFFDSLGGNIGGTEIAALYFIIFLIVPVTGFFFCALDKERNLKNIVSLICCLVGVVSILLVVTPQTLAIGSLFALLMYLVIGFLTSVSMMARIADNPNKDNK